MFNVKFENQNNFQIVSYGIFFIAILWTYDQIWVKPKKPSHAVQCHTHTHTPTHPHTQKRHNVRRMKYAGTRLHNHCNMLLNNRHTLCVHYEHAAADLHLGKSKYAKVAGMHYFFTIAIRTSRAVLTRAWASRRVDLREHRVNLFHKRVILCCWLYLNDF